MLFHQFAEVFPMLSGEEYAEFKAGIKESKGCRDNPIMYVKIGARKIGLDGRNRLRACLELRIKPTYRQMHITEEEIEDFILQQNVRRRHMSSADRRVVVANLRKQGKSERAIADIVKASPATVHRDVQTSGASNEAVDGKIIGTDGRKYTGPPDARCANCIRKHSPGKSTPGCAACAEVKKASRSNRQPGDEPRKASSKNGKPLFDWKRLDRDLGGLIRTVDDIAKQHDAKESPHYKSMVARLETVTRELNAWKRVLIADE